MSSARNGLTSFYRIKDERMKNDLSTFERPCNGVDFTPPAFNALVGPSNANAGFLAPVSHAFRDAIDCDVVGSSGVSHLLLLCCPPTIPRFVIAMIVDAVNRVLWGWSWSNVHKEQCKIIPARAGFYSTSAIVGIRRVIGVYASLSHLNPYSILSSFAPLVLFVYVVMGASATGNATPSQHASHDWTLNTARAFAQPENVAVRLSVRSNESEYGQFAKHLPSQVRFSVTLVCSHDGSTPLGLEPRGCISTFAARFIVHERGSNA